MAMVKVAAAAQEHGLEILGPPPGEALTSNEIAPAE
jgi:hypothetical protein